MGRIRDAISVLRGQKNAYHKDDVLLKANLFQQFQDMKKETQAKLDARRKQDREMLKKALKQSHPGWSNRNGSLIIEEELNGIKSFHDVRELGDPNYVVRMRDLDEITFVEVVEKEED